MLNFIYYPVSWILWFWHKVFGYIPFLGPAHGVTWALAVVFLVFTLRALLFKPFVSQVRSMRKMQEFAPQIKKLQEKHKGDRQKLAAEMQKLQSEHGVNPLGGCLPILVQIPVFIGLFQVLREFKPGKTENYVFNQPEVASFIQADLFGAKLSAYITLAQNQLELLGTTRPAVIAVSVPLMILASIATHWTARHSVERQSAAAAANPQAAIMNKLTLWVFPLGVLVGGFFFPIAILIYWLANNAWTLGQQWVVYRKIDREESEKKDVAVTQRQSLAPRPGQKPAAQKPAAQKPPVEKPAVEKPAVEKPAVEKPAVEKPAGKKPAVQKPPAQKPTQKPAAQKPKRPADSSPTGDGDTADGAAGDGGSVDGAATTGSSGADSAGDAPKTTDNGSRPQQRKQPPRVPQKKSRKRR